MESLLYENLEDILKQSEIYACEQFRSNINFINFLKKESSFAKDYTIINTFWDKDGYLSFVFVMNSEIDFFDRNSNSNRISFYITSAGMTYPKYLLNSPVMMVYIDIDKRTQKKILKIDELNCGRFQDCGYGTQFIRIAKGLLEYFSELNEIVGKLVPKDKNSPRNKIVDRDNFYRNNGFIVNVDKSGEGRATFKKETILE